MHFMANSLLKDTSTRWAPQQNRHLELVPACLYFHHLTLYKTDISPRHTLTCSVCPNGVHQLNNVERVDSTTKKQSGSYYTYYRVCKYAKF